MKLACVAVFHFPAFPTLTVSLSPSCAIHSRRALIWNETKRHPRVEMRRAIWHYQSSNTKMLDIISQMPYAACKIILTHGCLSVCLSLLPPGQGMWAIQQKLYEPSTEANLQGVYCNTYICSISREIHLLYKARNLILRDQQRKRKISSESQEMCQIVLYRK